MTTETPGSPGSNDEFQIELRVRFPECDPQGMAHHSVYAIWLEIARTELMRRNGAAYADLHQRGVLFVVARMSFRFRRPAKYDDLITVGVRLTQQTTAKLVHEYTIRRSGELLATAETTLACVDTTGRMLPIPPEATALG